MTAKEESNRANAQLSTGPRTDEGKAKSSLNALKSALTGRTVLLPSEDAALYRKHIHAFRDHYWPTDEHECILVQSLADLAWRLARIPTLEMAIFAKGRVEFAQLYADQPAKNRPALLDAHTLIAYEKQLRNLHLQEGRLFRRQQQESAALVDIQKLNRQRKDRDYRDATDLYRAAQAEGRSFDPREFGFEFSKDDIAGYVEGIDEIEHARRLASALPPGPYSPPVPQPTAA